jgi:hypothetical protein
MTCEPAARMPSEQYLERPLGFGLLAYSESAHRTRRCKQAEDYGGQCSHTGHEANCHKTHYWRSKLSVPLANEVGHAYHWIMKPSLSVLLQTHLVVPVPELVGVAPSGSVMVVGDRLADEL